MNNNQEQIIEQLLKIRNIVPVMAKKLYNAGIYDFDSLKKLGTEDAYMIVDESGGFCGTHHAAYLYALEASIINCKWQDFPEERKEELKDFAKSLRNHSKNF